MKCIFFFSSRRRHTRWPRDWSSDVCSSDLDMIEARLEEIYELSYREIRRMGYQDLPGGFVLTGGTMKIDGSLDLADRKSTRLNSSHVAISYAVFCLKKKREDTGQSSVRGVL